MIMLTYGCSLPLDQRWQPTLAQCNFVHWFHVGGPRVGPTRGSTLAFIKFVNTCWTCVGLCDIMFIGPMCQTELFNRCCLPFVSLIAPKTLKGTARSTSSNYYHYLSNTCIYLFTICSLFTFFINFILINY